MVQILDEGQWNFGKKEEVESEKKNVIVIGIYIR